ncbi:MAG TPA: condensation domain-containing protein, partial [Chloroflexota bacterium]
MGTLSDAQRTSLAARLRQGRTAAGTIPRRAPEVRELPLSFGQEQLWFIDQFAPGLPVYNIASALRLHGKLDAAALGRALDDLVARHEVLRSRLVNAQGRPLQVIDPPCARRLVVENLSAYEAAARETRLRELAKQEAASPFDLAAGPLFRARLIRLSSEEHVLLVCAHHTVFDGWSFEVFIRELTVLYQAHATGQAASLPEMPVQFADYALWERERLQGELLQDLVDYWRTALDGLSTMQMPTDRPRPLLQSFDGGFHKLNIDADVLDRLKLLSRQTGSTLFVTLLSAVQVLVHRYTGQDDIVVGTASANRSRPELAPLIGYLVNTLPIRTDTSGDPTFVDLLRKVRTTTIEAYAHQDLPFARLVEALRVER